MGKFQFECLTVVYVERVTQKRAFKVIKNILLLYYMETKPFFNDIAYLVQVNQITFFFKLTSGNFYVGTYRKKAPVLLRKTLNVTHLKCILAKNKLPLKCHSGNCTLCTTVHTISHFCKYLGTIKH